MGSKPLRRPAIVLAAMLLVLVGAMMRVLTAFSMDLRQDGNAYAAMGHAFAQTGTFLLPWGDAVGLSCALPAWSHHYPPLYPLTLGVVYSIAGFGVWQTKLAAVTLSLAALGVVYATTRDLFASERAWLVTGLLAVEPHLIWATGTGFSENLVLLLFALTMWGILKSLDRPWAIVVAGAAAALAYLTRASMGAFFVLAGTAGFLWRFYYMRWAVFRSKPYLVAMAVFGIAVFAWCARNVALFGWPHWQTSSYLSFTQRWAFDHPTLLLEGLAWKTPLFALYLAQYFVPFAKEGARSARNIREQSESALWLAAALVAILGLIIAAVFWTWEQYDVWWADNHRYVVIAFLPLTWLLMRHAEPSSRGFALRYGALALALLLLSAHLFVEPTRTTETQIAGALNARLEGGEEIGLVGMYTRYSFYPYLERHDVYVYGCEPSDARACPGQDPDLLVSNRGWETYPGYRAVAQARVHFRDLDMRSSWPFVTYEEYDGVTTLWEREGPGPMGPRPPGCTP